MKWALRTKTKVMILKREFGEIQKKGGETDLGDNLDGAKKREK